MSASVKRFRNKRVLITGASSFTGSRLVQRLVESGADVHAMVSPRKHFANLRQLRSSVTLWAGDICEPRFVQRIVKKSRPEIVYHLASFGVHPGQRSLRRLASVNVMGTVNLLTALAEVPFERLVNTGTSAEYGHCMRAMKEDQPLCPSTYYGATKAAATMIASAFGRDQKGRVITLRPFYIYGPGEGFDRVISDAVRACLRHKPFKITSYADKRDFIYIDDVVDAYLLAGTAKFTGTPVVNIGTSKESNLREILKTIAILTGEKMKILPGAYEFRPWKSRCWAADTQKARKILGWKPEVSLREGIARIIAWERRAESFSPKA